MQYEEQQLINGLFERLKQTGQQNSQRDADAERQIAEFVRQQPAAPYYMAQSILIQEAALKRLQARVQELESELAAQKSKPSTGGSFLGGLFGGGKSNPQPANSWNAQPQQPPAQDYSRAAAPASAPAPRSGGFMAGALQTAAGVAGGVVLAEMLTSMFHQSRPEEIVNIIEEPATPAGGDPFTANQYGDFNNVSDTRFLNQDDQFGNNNDAWQNDDFDDNDYSNDDDSFI
ncbi:DUF2076 domain-containing protein [Kosakonia radicincitans]|uniref:DUF2076 domain-containing protein n=1 Tax=Kosakonia TaxID=1330547 RepID=UPI000460EAAA|nr:MULTISPECIES: DUF2076 domain-containing protein [Kosakonia]APG18217.1 ABC transporter substrate-binding protein [Kosakonia radicincitans]KDE38027.1 hypothetical protein AW40_00635 [Kosakonia radicincitans UMEnt01/12]NCF06588.1 DUF2076 domain-containing protein [Kosakonia sp. MH5]PTA92053.1 DUF2076 domain-containing protein [Kosakonia sp. H7A]QEM91499.1 DUF2076 domain-containing protein [Kosakonia radicincitans]